MAYFAELDENNIVLRVIRIENTELLDETLAENEQRGILFCKSLYGENTKWVQTSYNTNFRKNYASPTFLYDEIRDAFIPPRPFPSWVLNENSCLWESPVPMPDIENIYRWNETQLNWDLVENLNT